MRIFLLSLALVACTAKPPGSSVPSTSVPKGDSASEAKDGGLRSTDAGVPITKVISSGGRDAGGNDLAQNPCADVSETGICSGNVTVWCYQGKLNSHDCTDDNLKCGYGPEGYVTCVNPCELVANSNGDCSGNVAVWCFEGKVQTDDCTKSNLTCGYGQEGYVTCI